MRYAWIDIETTGLNISENNEIIEIAIIITDGFFDRVDKFHAVCKPTSKCTWQSDVVRMHHKSGLLNDVLAAEETFSQVAPKIVEFLLKNGAGLRALTPAGNSVQFDVKFLSHYEPAIAPLLFHRHFDISSIRVAVVEMYGHDARFKSESKHRAADDLQDSMSELSHYVSNFFSAPVTN